MNPRYTMEVNHQTNDGRPTLEMIECYTFPKADAADALAAAHYMETHTVGRPLGTLPQYSVEEGTDDAWTVTRRSMLTGTELYKAIETAHQEALDEDHRRTLEECARILAEIRADDRKAMAQQDPTYTGPATAPREYVDTPRTYETTSAALELSNTESLYTAARRLISRRLAQTDPDTENRTPAQVAADALKEYVEGIIDEQDTRNPHTALLVALANAATTHVDWEDVAEQISADL